MEDLLISVDKNCTFNDLWKMSQNSSSFVSKTKNVLERLNRENLFSLSKYCSKQMSNSLTIS